MARVRMVDMYSQYFGTTKREARQKVALVLDNLSPEAATRYFKALEDVLSREAVASFYED